MTQTFRRALTFRILPLLTAALPIASATASCEQSCPHEDRKPTLEEQCLDPVAYQQSNPAGAGGEAGTSGAGDVKCPASSNAANYFSEGNPLSRNSIAVKSEGVVKEGRCCYQVERSPGACE